MTITLCALAWLYSIYVICDWSRTWHSAGEARPVSSIMILSSLRLQYSCLNKEHSSWKYHIHDTCLSYTRVSVTWAMDTWTRRLKISGPTLFMLDVVSITGSGPLIHHHCPPQWYNHWFTKYQQMIHPNSPSDCFHGKLNFGGNSPTETYDAFLSKCENFVPLFAIFVIFFASRARY